MKIFPCMLSSEKIEQKNEFLHKNIIFYKNLKFKSNTPYELNEYKFIDLILNNIGTDLKENIYFDNDTLYVCNILFTADEKLLVNCNNYLSVTFINCVFMKWIKFTKTPENITFDNCVINEFPSLPQNKVNSIDFQSSSINKINYSGDIDSFSMSNCFVEIFEIHNLKCNTFYLYLNKIIYISLSKINSNDIDFDPSQFIEKNSNSPFFTKHLKEAINFSKIIEKPMKYSDNNINERLELGLSTLFYLRQNTYYKYDSIAISKIDYIIKILLNRNIINRIFFWPLGYFLKPYRIVYTSLSIMLVFSGAFLIFDLCSNNPIQSTNHYFYKSFQHFFMNIDKDYKGLSSIFQIFEGLIGMLLLASFPVSLVKKYLQ